MQALIRADKTSFAASSHDIAGRPLLVRQLQWLRDCGVEHVVVGVRPESSLERLATDLAGESALISSVSFIPDAGALSTPLLLLRAGLRPGALTCVIPGDVIGGADLHQVASQTSVSRRMVLAKPTAVPSKPTASNAFVDVWRDGLQPTQLGNFDGWGSRLSTAAEALAFGAAALAGRLPPIGGVNRSNVHIHGAQRAPGVWLGRGARVEPGAQLVAPVFVGPDALVCRDAQVGPAAVLHARSVVDRGSIVAGSVIGASVIVGEGIQLRGKRAESNALIDLASGARMSLHDRLLLGRRPAFA